MRAKGLFSRPWTITAEGQFIDNVDNKPFSTYFSHTRFLVPHLARTLGVGPQVLFMDSDMVCLSDLSTLLNTSSSSAAVSVVKHDFKEEGIKMDGQVQQSYHRKLWSAFMLFDVTNPYTRDLTPDVVNTKSGAFLHQFKWCPDNMIGSLPEGWNWIPSHSPRDEAIHNIHYTRGSPEFPKYTDAPMADVWYRALVRSLKG